MLCKYTLLESHFLAIRLNTEENLRIGLNSLFLDVLV
jgi:hypothetical protein